MLSNHILENKDILQIIGGIYNTMHLFDFEQGACQEIYAFKEVHEFFIKYVDQVSIQELIHLIIKNTTTKEYLPSLLEFTNFDSLSDRIAGKKTLSFDFIGSIHGWTRCSFIPVAYDSEGKLKQVIYTTRNIQEDKAKEDSLLSASDIDENTGFANLRALTRESARMEKEGIPEQFTLISFDINGLNDVNHRISLEAGDELVLGAAECIKKVYGEKGQLYRIGGDVFVVYINTTLNELVNYFNKFDSITANWKGKLVSELTISKGVAAHLEFPDLTVRELQAKADQRMYQEKESYYLNKSKNNSNFLQDPEIFPSIMKKSFMGLISLEFSDNCEPRLLIDDYIKDFLGINNYFTPEEMYNEWVKRTHPDYVDTISTAIEKIIIGNQTEVQYPWFHPKSGLVYIRSFGYRDPTYTNGVRINGFFQNVTNLVHLQKDDLTGFYTKETFFQKADELLMKNPNKNYRFFVSDIENFKTVNDKYGIELSDKLLQYLATKLKKTASNLVLAGRLAGDVFVCMQEDNDVVQTSKEGYSLQKSIIAGAPIQNFMWKHGICYTKSDKNANAQQMCDRARFALESIKGNYQRACAIYDDKLAKTIRTRQQILDNMEDALRNNEFKVYLQPKHDLHQDKTGGAEALVRWIHPEIGFMNPGEFIPLFEKNGFVKNMDEFVLREICSVLHRWLTEGKPVVPISVNLSRRDFEQDDLADMIISVADENQLPHELLHFEVTESAFSDNPEKIAETLKQIHDAGFAIELDDFGSGYSSLTFLSEIEFDILKLDMSIIRKDNPSSSRNVLDMCSHIVKRMNLKSVAEGVETESQLQRLKDIGCDYIQGYYYSKPLPIEEFEAYLQKEL